MDGIIRAIWAAAMKMAFYGTPVGMWRNGGTFVIKGVSTLDRDMSSALSYVLMSNFGEK